MAGLYLHIPFCEHKCIYCDFYSIENLRGMDAFLDALDREFGMVGKHASCERFGTIYFGGGTPSLLSPVQLERILSRLYSTFSVEPGAEVTLETNPGTVDGKKLKDYRSLGINRLSVGIQSFRQAELDFMTRIHSADQAKDCVRAAHRAGFDNVSVDLFFALPGQTMEGWQSNLRQAVDLQPRHISAYSLIVERGTPLARMVAAKQVSPLPLEQDAAMYEWTMEFLAARGYDHYEVSNYAEPGYRSRHNSGYWRHANYLGFGPSAHSFWNSGEGGRRRWWNIANLGTYVEKVSRGIEPVAGDESLTDQQLFEEAIMLGLRSDGVDIDLLRGQYGFGLSESVRSFVGGLIQENLAVLEGHRFRLTDRGYLVCDEICERILTQCESSPAVESLEGTVPT